MAVYLSREDVYAFHPQNEEHLAALLAEFSRPLKIVPFVGAGLSAPCFPSWRKFLEESAARLGIGSKVDDYLEKGAYEEAAQELVRARADGRSRGAWKMFQNSFASTFSDARIDQSKLQAAKALLDLRLDLTVTTNFDHVLEQVLSPERFREIVLGAKPDLVASILEAQQQVLLKVHGDMSDGTDRILTADEYKVGYENAEGSGKMRTLSELLRELFLRRTVLFVGCSLHTDRTLAVLRSAFTLSDRLHFAIVSMPGAATSAETQNRRRFLEEHGIIPIWYPDGRHECLGDIISLLGKAEDVVMPPAQRAALCAEVTEYAQALIANPLRLPSFYPQYLQQLAASSTPASMARLRQRVRVRDSRQEEDIRRAHAERLREKMQAAGYSYEPQSLRADAQVLKLDDFARENRAIVDWDSFINTHTTGHVVILGDPGFGKSSLLRSEAYRLASALADSISGADEDPLQKVLPILVTLRSLSQRLTPDQSDSAALESALIEKACKGRAPLFRKFVIDKIAQGQVVLLMDAWDEVASARTADYPDRPSPRELLYDALSDYSSSTKCSILLTSRFVGFRPSPLPRARVLELQPFEISEITLFVRLWFEPSANLAEHFLETLLSFPALNGLARIPLLLSLLCRVFEQPGSSFPIRRIEVYEQCVYGLLLLWKADKYRGMQLSRSLADLLVDRLAQAALNLFPREQFDISELLAHTRDLNYHDQVSFEHSLRSDGILVPGSDSSDQLSFLHRTFHEYLASRRLAMMFEQLPIDSARELVADHAMDSNWHGLFILLIGQLRAPEVLLMELADPTKDTLFGQRLALAGRSAAELTKGQKVRLVSLIVEMTERAAQIRTKYFGPLTDHLEPALSLLLASGGTVEEQDVGQWIEAILCEPGWRFKQNPMLDRIDTMAKSRLLPPLSSQLLVKFHNLPDTEYLEAMAKVGGWRLLDAVPHASAEKFSRALMLALLSDRYWSGTQWQALELLIRDTEAYSHLLQSLAGRLIAEGGAKVASALARVALHAHDVFETRTLEKYFLTASDEDRKFVADTVGQHMEWAGAARIINVDVLTLLLTDPHPGVRFRALWGLGGNPSIAAVPVVSQKLGGLLDDGDAEVAIMAAKALLRSGLPSLRGRGSDSLASLLRGNSDAWTRLRIVDTLEKLGSDAGGDELIECLGQLCDVALACSDPAISMYLTALTYLGPEVSRYPRVVAMAVSCLGGEDFDSIEVVDRLGRVSRRTFEWSGWQAAYLLSRVSISSQSEGDISLALRKLLTSDDPVFRGRASVASRCYSSVALPHAIEISLSAMLTESSDRDYQAEAAKTIALVGREAFQKDLCDWIRVELSHRDDGRRKQAFEVASLCRGEQFLHNFRDWEFLFSEALSQCTSSHYAARVLANAIDAGVVVLPS